MKGSPVVVQVLYIVGCMMFGACLYWWIFRPLERRFVHHRPRGVQLVLVNGETVTLTVKYIGRIDGIHHWSTVEPVAMEDFLAGSMRVARLPAKTSLGVLIRSG